MAAPESVRVLPGVRIVASGWLGLSLTAPTDCTAYLLDGGGDAVLIDSGCGLADEQVLALVGDTAVSRILLTHAHADHAGGAAGLGSSLAAEVLADPATARIVAGADEDAAGLTDARAAGVYPDDVRLVPVPVRPLSEEAFPVGALDVTAIPTPGHAASHTCFVTTVAGRRVAFTGDLVFSRGRVAVLDTPDTDVNALHASLRRLADAEPDVLLPGHGEPVLADAGAHLRAALDAFSAGHRPAGLLP